jgi:hypothetical protein
MRWDPCQQSLLTGLTVCVPAGWLWCQQAEHAAGIEGGWRLYLGVEQGVLL